MKLLMLAAREHKGVLSSWVCFLVLFSFSGITESHKLHKTWTGNNQKLFDSARLYFLLSNVHSLQDAV